MAPKRARTGSRLTRYQVRFPFGTMAGKLLDNVVCIGRVNPTVDAGDMAALVIRDARTGSYYIVSPECMSPEPEPDEHPLLSRCATQEMATFAHLPGSLVAVKLDGNSFDHHGNPLDGVEVPNVTVLHQIYDAKLDERWYVLQLPPPHWNTNDKELWFTGLEMKHESDI